MLTCPNYFRRERNEQLSHVSVLVTYRFDGPTDDIIRGARAAARLLRIDVQASTSYRFGSNLVQIDLQPGRFHFLRSAILPHPSLIEWDEQYAAVI